MIKNIKWGIISGAIAAVIAFLASLAIGHTSVLVAFLRALCFLAAFFALGTGMRLLINAFIPELLAAAARNDDIAGQVFSVDGPGSQVNITVDDNLSPAMPSMGGGIGGEEVGDFSDLPSGGSVKDVDQSYENGYNSGEDFPPGFDNGQSDGMGDFSMDFGGLTSGSSAGGEAESSDSSEDSFSFFSGDDAPAAAEAPERKASGNKTQQLEGDFNAKDIAAGIRTVLEKDKKG
ncbi:MAG: hypothetical protein LBI06_05660 [Treponema sp.]|jgi:hypothetical protein|nr:hypothetical protein [Treponema sp.]